MVGFESAHKRITDQDAGRWEGITGDDTMEPYEKKKKVRNHNILTLKNDHQEIGYL